MRVARFRMGNEVKERRYWEEEKKKLCRLCEGEVETWEHVWERCRDWKEGGGSWQEAVNWILGENGEGESWMKEWERENKRREGKVMREKNEGERESEEGENKRERERVSEK